MGRPLPEITQYVPFLESVPEPDNSREKMSTPRHERYFCRLMMIQMVRTWGIVMTIVKIDRVPRRCLIGLL
jgi:hypothetical protein